MKISLTLLFALIMGSSDRLISQITIAEYPKQIVCQVDATQELEAPAAKSTCSEVKVIISENLFSGGCLGTMVRTYTYSDQCGNNATAEQYISLKDNLAPELIGVPEDLTTDELHIPQASIVSARDNSGHDTEVEFSEEKKDGFIIRTWTSTDPCNNKAVGVQKIKLR